MFNDFIEIFPSENLEFLYGKEGEVSSVDGKTKLNMNDEGLQVTGLDLEDKGAWTLSSYVYTEKSTEGTGVSITFDKNTRKARGNFILIENHQRTRYPVFYDEGKIHLVDEKSTPDNVREKFDNFKMMYEFIELDREYLDDLKSTRINYNSNVPMFDANYKLKSDDKNIAKIKEVYPELTIDEKNCELELKGSGEPWNLLGRIHMEISLDGNNETYLTGRMSFGRTRDAGKED